MPDNVIGIVYSYDFFTYKGMVYVMFLAKHV